MNLTVGQNVTLKANHGYLIGQNFYRPVVETPVTITAIRNCEVYFRLRSPDYQTGRTDCNCIVEYRPEETIS